MLRMCYDTLVEPRRNVAVRLIRPGQEEPVDDDWKRSTMAERIEAVWQLTLDCAAWTSQGTDELRLQRSVGGIQRQRR